MQCARSGGKGGEQCTSVGVAWLGEGIKLASFNVSCESELPQNPPEFPVCEINSLPKQSVTSSAAI